MAKRKVQNNIDQASIENQAYNEKSGAQKNAEVGRYLVPLDDGAGAKTTNAATARSIPKGRNLAVYNNAGAVGAITLGDESSVAALAPGVTDALQNGHVGIPCAPNDWTYIACWDKTFVRASAATLLVFIIGDDTAVN